MNEATKERSELDAPAGSALRRRMIYILNNSANKMNRAFTIARIIEHEDAKKPGSMHLAVKREMDRMRRDNLIGILPPETEHDSYTLYLRQNKVDMANRKP